MADFLFTARKVVRWSVVVFEFHSRIAAGLPGLDGSFELLAHDEPFRLPMAGTSDLLSGRVQM
eukprot:2742835-Alexandrium_andersonii.AAC.1